jgi:hypothetical protein
MIGGKSDPAKAKFGSFPFPPLWSQTTSNEPESQEMQ